MQKRRWYTGPTRRYTRQKREDGTRFGLSDRRLRLRPDHRTTRPLRDTARRGSPRRGSESVLFELHKARRSRRSMRVGFWWEGCPVREAASLPRSSPLGLKRSQAQQGQPVRMTLTRHQLPRALAPALGTLAAQEAEASRSRLGQGCRATSARTPRCRFVQRMVRAVLRRPSGILGVDLGVDLPWLLANNYGHRRTTKPLSG